jgi:hypothetical protein
MHYEWKYSYWNEKSKPYMDGNIKGKKGYKKDY